MKSDRNRPTRGRVNILKRLYSKLPRTKIFYRSYYQSLQDYNRFWNDYLKGIV